MAIYFYKVNEAYGCFSNFAPYGFIVNGVFWKTSEHFFQAHKFSELEYFEKIRLADSPMKAANLGRSRKYPIREDWEQVKDDITRKAVFEKFAQNSEIRNILLETENESLIEATKDDYYWGCGTEGYGKNMLGKILMEVRLQLKD